MAVVPHGDPVEAPVQAIGVGYDGSPDADAAVTTACEVARRLGARLRVIRAFDAAFAGTPELMGRPGYETAIEELEAFARGDLDRRVAALPEDVAAEAMFLLGSPVRQLADQTEDVDLMMLGSRGYGPIRSVLLGGVSNAVLHEAACPMLVLPRGARHGVDELFGDAALPAGRSAT